MKEKEKEVIIINQGITSAIAICMECNYRYEGRTYAKKEALNHCKTTGHKVLLEEAVATRYQSQ